MTNTREQHCVKRKNSGKEDGTFPTIRQGGILVYER
jgi:hypothetical protein